MQNSLLGQLNKQKIHNFPKYQSKTMQKLLFLSILFTIIATEKYKVPENTFIKKYAKTYMKKI